VSKPAASSKEQFNALADNYAASQVHRAGPSLPILLELAEPNRNDRVLDVATGAGHTALMLAPFVEKVLGIDVAPKMLDQARALAAERGQANVSFVEGSAEALPFAEGEFSLVTARHAPHHFRQIERFLAEVRRVLIPNGRFVMVDQICPIQEFSGWLDSWERQRDPSHFVQRTVDQWQTEAVRARFRWAASRIVPYRLEFDWWVKTSGCSAATVGGLERMAAEASPAVRDILKLEYDESGRIIAFGEPMLVVKLEPVG
jgi:ubiquinone/menaquinone biosynthesis C-methylase UbiE